MLAVNILVLCFTAIAHYEAVASPAPKPNGPTVTIDSGVVIGITTALPHASSVVNKFLGIPYAAPAERWTPAKKAKPWRQPLTATAFGPACIQAWNTNPLGPDLEVVKALVNSPPLPENEDCLTINVFTPANESPKDGRAVMALTHGGGFQLGGSQMYDPSPLAAYEDIIVVSFNYRTNIFGFTGSTEVPLKERNLGLLDQRFALEWVQNNIRAFGGDPAKVTIWGTSSGAESVDAHLISYGKGSNPPFRAAIMESGQISVGLLSFRNDNLENWKMITAAANCSTVESPLKCMKALPADKLKVLQEETRISFTPVIDNVTIPSDPAQKRKTGDFAQVPVLSGTVAQEGRLLINDKISMDDFLNAFLNPAYFPDDLKQQVVAAYPKGQNGLETDFDVASAIYTDFLWQCPQTIVSHQIASNSLPSWRYYYNASSLAFVPANLTWLGKCHGLDNFILYSNPDDARHNPQTYTLANFMRSAWARFVKNPAAGPGWPAVGTERFGPVDVAVLGDAPDAQAGGATVMDEKTVDEKCALYKAVLDGISGYEL